MANKKPVKPKSRSLRLLRMFAGEMQLKIGANVSDDAAMYELFRLYRPDLIELLHEIELEEENTKNEKR
jgi:hypothetical protein